MITQRYLRFLITLYYFEKNSILPLNKNFAEILNLSKSSISKTITYLSDNKLIYKTINNRIYLLPLGYDVLNEYIKIIIMVFIAIFVYFSICFVFRIISLKDIKDMFNKNKNVNKSVVKCIKNSIKNSFLLFF